MKIGCDIIQNDRIISILKNKEKVFTELEISYCEVFENKELHYASIFCAKEAVYKALNVYNMSFYSVCLGIEILHNDNNRPYVKLNGEYFADYLKYNLDISISNEKDYSVAFAIAY